MGKREKGNPPQDKGGEEVEEEEVGGMDSSLSLHSLCMKSPQCWRLHLLQEKGGNCCSHDIIW